MNPLFFLNMIPLPWKIVASTLAVVAIFFAGYFHGKKVEHVNFENYQIAQEKKYADLQKIIATTDTKIVTQYLTTTNTIEKKVPVYVQIANNNVPPQHQLSLGWLFLHNIAATNGDPDPTRSSNAAPSGIEDNTALATITENYGICHENAEQLKSLQSWINTLSKNNQGAK